MNIISINLNDTIALSDSTIIELAKLVNSGQTYVQETTTNCYDVEIVKNICLAVVVTVFIIAITLGIIVWHNYRKIKCDDLKKEKSDLSEKLKEATKAKESLEEEVKKLKNNNKDKSEYEQASELLDRISSLSRPKDGITDDEIAEKLFNLYIKMKRDFKGNDNKNSSKG